ncbi:pimeloyl-ACP methyl ester carboxylesterase [Paenarthrobacter sp. TE4293]|uniref:alpha/beta fold hydrolase n=1 Tax=Paenarthrobacter sp. TE4293 TaxID=3381695 RepID=UPI003D23AEF7
MASVETVFEEDHLVPLALANDTLFAFSRLDGNLYKTSVRGRGKVGEYQALPMSDLLAPFCVPGRPFIYDLIHGDNMVTVREFALLESGLGAPSVRSFEAPADSTHRLISLVPDAAEATLCAVFEPLFAGGTWFLLNIHAGNVRPCEVVSGGPKCILADGTLVAESDTGWSTALHGIPVRNGPGSVISVTSDFAVVRRSDKTGSLFSLVSGTDVQDIAAPAGWNIISLAASDTRITAYAIHSALGQRLLHMAPKDGFFTFDGTEAATSQVFAMGADVDPVIRSTGLVQGSSWRTSRGVFAGIASERVDLRAVHLTLAGLPCVYVQGRQPGAGELLVCLHGGPDSHELDDLRFGGTYRKLLDAGFDLLMVNYPGSAGFGVAFQEQAWHNWDGAVQSSADAVAGLLKSSPTSAVSILGVSFGAWIGLQLAAHLQARRVVALSPIIDLHQHLLLHGDDPEFRTWAEARFAFPALAPHGGEPDAPTFAGPVIVIAPDSDEVVLPASTQKSVLTAQKSGRAWTSVTVPGNHYPQVSADAERRWAALVAALTRSRTP